MATIKNECNTKYFLFLGVMCSLYITLTARLFAALHATAGVSSLNDTGVPISSMDIPHPYTTHMVF